MRLKQVQSCEESVGERIRGNDEVEDIGNACLKINILSIDESRRDSSLIATGGTGG